MSGPQPLTALILILVAVLLVVGLEIASRRRPSDRDVPTPKGSPSEARQAAPKGESTKETAAEGPYPSRGEHVPSPSAPAPSPETSYVPGSPPRRRRISGSFLWCLTVGVFAALTVAVAAGVPLLLIMSALALYLLGVLLLVAPPGRRAYLGWATVWVLGLLPFAAALHVPFEIILIALALYVVAALLLATRPGGRPQAVPETKPRPETPPAPEEVREPAASAPGGDIPASGSTASVQPIPAVPGQSALGAHHPARLAPLRAPHRWTIGVLVLEGAAVAASFLWFGPQGVLERGFGFHVSFLVLPAIGASSLVSAIALSSIWLSRPFARAVNIALLGVAAAVLLRVLFPYLPRLYPAGQTILPSLGSAGNRAACLPLGIGLLMATRIVLVARRREILASLAETSAWVYVGSVAWWATSALRGQVPAIAGAGGVVFWASAAMGLVPLAWHGLGSRNIVVAGVSRWAHRSWARVLSVGVLIGLYVAFLRPLFSQVVQYFILWEWFLGVSIVLVFSLLTTGQIVRLRHAAEREREWQEWQKHRLAVARHPWARYETAAEVQRAFVESGFKADLVVLLVAYLRDNRIPLGEIAATMAPLINHVDPPLPRLPLWWSQKRVRQKSAAVRKVLLRDVMAGVMAVVVEWRDKVVGQPAEEGPESNLVASPEDGPESEVAALPGKARDRS